MINKTGSLPEMNGRFFELYLQKDTQNAVGITFILERSQNKTLKLFYLIICSAVACISQVVEFSAVRETELDDCWTYGTEK
ncbi:hypothetical protein DX928_17590 [Bacillus swezeyi]|uniref:Uncharacterized protein n=1 Tax=Bacillus swezeyi TaxID=1925020 RepID=A0A5M8RP04_9BACI|nr:hypothetical protein DX927_17275 [Bacillus swezeyi]KAA6474383.1 hypothetical protein DX928_17590 [Bacillus swezeyi]